MNEVNINILNSNSVDRNKCNYFLVYFELYQVIKDANSISLIFVICTCRDNAAKTVVLMDMSENFPCNSTEIYNFKKADFPQLYELLFKTDWSFLH